MTETLKEASYHKTLAVSETNYHPTIKTKQSRFDSIEPTKRKLKLASKTEINNNENSNGESQQECFRAVQFKYTENETRAAIEDVRKLLARQRDSQLFNDEEWQFFKSDYDRMMVDDWLVTRFLLRGRKAASLLPIAFEAKQFDDSNPEQNLVGAKTMELIEICARFRYEYRINAKTRESEFPLEWTSANGMFHYGHDRASNPIVYLRVALHKPKLIESAELRHQFYRYMLYVLEQCDQDLFQKPGKAICCVFDMSNVAFENIDLELTSWMIKSFKSCAPKLLCYVIVYNPPWFFTATFKLICSTLLSNNRRQSIKFAYGREILDYIDHNNLPPYLNERLSNTKR